MWFWLGKVALPAAVINAVLNFAIGRAVYPAGRPVPSFGQMSAANDFLVGALLIGFFTWLTLPGMGANEARAGRVRGRRRARWLRWLVRHRVVGGLAFGALLIGAAGVPAVALLVRLGSTLPRDEFLVGKVVFSVAVGTLAALAAAFAGVLPEDDATADPRWHKGTAPGLVYPCDPADKGCVALTDVARGCSVTPTWQLVVRGSLDETQLRRALADLVVRYPSLTTRVQALDGAPPRSRHLRYAADPAFALDKIFEVVDLRATPEKLPTVERELKNRPLDLFFDFPVTLSWLRLAEDRGRLVFRQHHGIADGRAFIGLLVDFAAYLEHARTGRRPTEAQLAPIGRRSELDGISARGWRRTAWTAAGFFHHIANIARGIFRPTTPLHQNRGLDYTGDNDTLHWTIDERTLAAWQARRKALGVSLNSFLTAALLGANRRWHDALGRRVGRTQAMLAMETRPRESSRPSPTPDGARKGDPEFVSFANHLGAFFVTVPLDREHDLATLAARVQREVDRQRTTHLPEKRLLAQSRLVSWVTLEDIHRVVYDQTRPLTNLDFSNLIPLEFADLGGEGWSVDEVLITTPVVPRTGIVLTVIRYRSRVTFNLNFKSSVVSRDEAAALLQHFQAALADF
jgi:hypothetical protein